MGSCYGLITFVSTIIFINKELYIPESIDTVINLIVKANKELIFR